MRLALAILTSAALLLPDRADAEDRPTPPPDAAVFASGLHLREPALSPEGERLAMVATHAKGEAILVLQIAKGESKPVYRFSDPDMAVTDLSWLDGGRLLVRLEAADRDSAGESIPTSALMLIDTETGAHIGLYNGHGAAVHWGNMRGRIVHSPRQNPEALLLANAEDRGLSVVRIDTRNAGRSRLLLPRGSVINYWADVHGEPRAALVREAQGFALQVREPDAGRWLTRQRWPSTQRISPLGFDADPRYFLMHRSDQGQPAVLRLRVDGPEDQAPGNEVLLSHPALSEAHRLLRRADTGMAVGMQTATGTLAWGDKLDELLAGLAAVLPGQQLRILQWQGDRYLLQSGSATEPVRYWLGRRSSKELSPLLNSRPQLAALPALERQSLVLAGQKVELLRRGGSEGKQPLLWCMDCWLHADEADDFNPLPIYLATQGYTVLMPRSIVRRDEENLLRLSQRIENEQRAALKTALADDGLRLDASRVHLLGRGLLGMSALRWAASEPERVRSVSVIDALTDLERYADLDREPFVMSFRRLVRQSLQGLSGNEMRVASPLAQAKSLPPRLLLVHGERSAAVDSEHSRSLAAARRDAGLPVALLLLKNSSSDIRHAAYRQQVLEAIEAQLR